MLAEACRRFKKDHKCNEPTKVDNDGLKVIYFDLILHENECKLIYNVMDFALENIELIKQFTSTGYLRKRLPKKLVEETKSIISTGVANESSLLYDETVDLNAEEELESKNQNAGMKIDERQIAKLKGFEGDPCNECGSFTLVRNGTCLKCNNCGSTTGCS